jgi:hypothetical protein
MYAVVSVYTYVRMCIYVRTYYYLLFWNFTPSRFGWLDCSDALLIDAPDSPDPFHCGVQNICQGFITQGESSQWHLYEYELLDCEC